MMIADKDLVSMQQARILVENAFEAQKKLATFPQEALDVIVEGVAQAVEPHIQTLAIMSSEETAYGRWQDKSMKNHFACGHVVEHLRGMRCVGVLAEDSVKQIREIGIPLGVIVALPPSTSPVSTTIYKALLAIKSGNAIVFSPHPRAAHSIRKVLGIMIEAAHALGLPRGCLAFLDVVTKSGTEELMRHPYTSLVMATGVCSMLDVISKAGKPLIYGGTGNGPAFIERSANLTQAVQDIIRSKTFDNGLAPSSEQSLVVDAAVAQDVKRRLQQCGAYFMSDEESHRLAKVLFTSDKRRRRETIGQSASVLAEKANISAPANTSLLVAERKYVREADPYSRELLAPVFAYYVEDDWRHACEKCIEILLVEGNAHTLVIHSTDEEVISQFALKKPVARVLANTPGVFGGLGAATNLFPAMTLGSGLAGYGMTSDNVSPVHLTYRRRLAYGVRTEGELYQNTFFTQNKNIDDDSEMVATVRSVLNTILKNTEQPQSRSESMYRGDK